MYARFFAMLALGIALGGTGTVEAAMCAKCRDLMFIDGKGKCSACGADTSSGALKLCPKCSTSKRECEHCQTHLTDADLSGAEKPASDNHPAEQPSGDRPAAEDSSGNKPLKWQPPDDTKKTAPPAETMAPPPSTPALPPATMPGTPAPANPLPDVKAAEPPVRIDPARSGAYVSGKWKYQLEIKQPGTAYEGRWGWLSYAGQKLPRGEANDYYRTPWGPVYWVDVPDSPRGIHGWMPMPQGRNPRQGRALALPAALAGTTPDAAPPTPGANPAANPAAANSRPVPTLELSKSHNGQLAKVHVGNRIIVRLPGNPTTGYQWRPPASLTPQVRLVSSPQYMATPVPTGMTGGGGTFTFTFQVVQPGTGAIKLYYVRPWEKTAPPLETFTVNVSSQPAGVPSSAAPTRPPAQSSPAQSPPASKSNFSLGGGLF